MASVLSATPRTRPPNRRELILAAATELFAARGYEYVGRSEIAEEVAVQPSALYRHFAGKEQLLAEILRQGVASLLAAVSEADLGAPGGLAGLAGFVLDHRHITALVGREAPHLGAAERAALRSELAQARQLPAGQIGAVRAGLRPAGREFLAWSALAVLQSPSFHRAELPRAEFCLEITHLAERVIAAGVSIEDVAASLGIAAGGPEAALRDLIGSYASSAAGHPAFIDLTISKVRSLPEYDCGLTLAAQRDYVAELAQLLCRVDRGQLDRAGQRPGPGPGGADDRERRGAHSAPARPGRRTRAGRPVRPGRA